MKLQSLSWFRRRPVRRPITRARLELEALESRMLFSVDVLTYRNDTSSSGENLNETQLTPASVSSGSFGQLFNTPLDGQVYAQPLVKTGVMIASGPNTVAGAAGEHDVVFVATENDSVYAIDDNTGAVLWHRSFLNTTDPNDALAGATSVVASPYQDATAAPDIAPTFGITGTPVIDPNTNTMYLVTATKEMVGGTAHYVQRLHGINLADGTDVVAPYLVGDTVGEDTYDLSVPVTNNTQIYVYGDGQTSITDPYNGTGQSVVQFNGLHENQHTALSLVNGTLYATWSSHGGSHPYYGWVVSWDVSNLSSNGFQLSGVLNTAPNTGLGGIWEGSGRLVFEPGSNTFYFASANGDGVAESLDANGFPSNDDFSDSIVKVVPDSTTTPQNQNPNGWGMKVADFFTAYNQQLRGFLNEDFGSGGPLLLPPSAGIPGHPNLLIVGGKDGKLFLADRDNLGGFSPTSDNVLDSVPNGQGINTPPSVIHGIVSTPLYFNGTLYVVGSYSDVVKAFTINSDGTLRETAQTSNAFGFEPAGPVVSANGASNAILWMIDRNTNELQAYDPNNLADELWGSGENGPDSLDSTSKMGEPTVANGVVYVGTVDGLVAFGLKTPTAAPAAPTLSATALSGTSVQLTWHDPSERPNTAQYYTIQVSTDGVNFRTLTTAAPGSVSYTVGGLTAQTAYSFRILGTNAAGASLASNVVNVTTGGAAPSLNFANGFAGSSGQLSSNGSAIINGTKAELTDGGSDEVGSVFTSQPVSVTAFQSSFTFQLSSGDTADGFTFTLQGVSPTALGLSGGGLGYGPDTPGAGGGIAQSVAIKFDLYDNQGEGSDSTGLYVGGASPTEPGSIDLTGSGIDLHSGDVFRADLGYDGTNLTVTLTDTATGATATQKYTIDIPSAVGGSTAYAGFTGGTGGLTATQSILSWTYSGAGGTGGASAPPAPTNVSAAAASGHSINLTWGENSANVTGFYLDRAIDPGFTQNLITEFLPPGPNAFTDTVGLEPGITYYYRLRAFNAAGASVDSAVVTAFIPTLPAQPSSLTVTSVTSSAVNLSWSDNGGPGTGYWVFRSTAGGPFNLVATLSGSASNSFTWKDTSVSPGTHYDYRVQAFNVTGASGSAIASTSTPSSATPKSPPPAAAAAAAAVNVFQSFNQLESNAFVWMLDNIALFTSAIHGIRNPALMSQIAELQSAINANPLNNTPLGNYALSLGYQLALSSMPGH